MNKRKDIIIIIDMMSAESADVTLGRKNPINSCCTRKQKCLQSEIQEGVEQVAILATVEPQYWTSLDRPFFRRLSFIRKLLDHVGHVGGSWVAPSFSEGTSTTNREAVYISLPSSL